MIRSILFIAGVALAFIAEHAIERLTVTWPIAFPLTAGVWLLWTQMTGGRGRIAVALAGGLALDAVSALPFGVHSLSLVAALFIGRIPERAVSKSEPAVHLAAGWAITFFAYSTALAALSALIINARIGIPATGKILLIPAAMQIILWSVIVPGVYLMVFYLIRRIRPRMRTGFYA